MKHNVVLVDNGSLDNTSARVAIDFPHVRVLRLPSNHAFAEATNTGVATCSSPVIILMNNDVACRPDFIEQLVAPLDQDPTIASVAAFLLQADEEHIDSIGLAADPTLACFPRAQGRHLAPTADDELTLLGPAGAAAAYRRTAWESTGGLDEKMFAYMEDFELAVRLRAEGWGAAEAHGAVAVHLGSATHGSLTSGQRRNGGFGRAYLLRRYGILRTRRAFRTIATETLVAVSDGVLSHDFAALRGRLEGWSGARDMPRRELPPPVAIDSSVTFLRSIRLRRAGFQMAAAKR